MKFRTGFVVGLGVGFILGARAGRERYDQLMGAVGSVRGSEKVRRAAGRGLVIASETIRERSESNGSGTTA